MVFKWANTVSYYKINLIYIFFLKVWFIKFSKKLHSCSVFIHRPKPRPKQFAIFIIKIWHLIEIELCFDAIQLKSTKSIFHERTSIDSNLKKNVNLQKEKLQWKRILMNGIKTISVNKQKRLFHQTEQTDKSQSGID